MPAPLNVDREQVRMLVLAVGVTEAARRTSIDLSTVKQWSARGKWLSGAKAAQSLATGPQTPARDALAATLPESMRPVTVTNVTKPADALAEILAERRDKTRLGLSKYASRAAGKAAEMDEDELLAQAPSVKAVADIAGKVWPEQGQVSVRISMFGTSAAPVEVAAIDAEIVVERIGDGVER